MNFSSEAWNRFWVNICGLQAARVISALVLFSVCVTSTVIYWEGCRIEFIYLHTSIPKLLPYTLTRPPANWTLWANQTFVHLNFILAVNKVASLSGRYKRSWAFSSACQCKLREVFVHSLSEFGALFSILPSLTGFFPHGHKICLCVFLFFYLHRNLGLTEILCLDVATVHGNNKVSSHHTTLHNLWILCSRYLAVQGGFPGHGVPRRGRRVLWFGWLLGSPGLMCGRKKRMKNYGKEKKKCHLSRSKWEVQQFWPYETDVPSSLSVAYTNLHIHFICTWQKTKYITQAEEEWDFLSSREGQSPSWINPCLRVLIPSPSWIGLNSFLFIFFPPPLHFEWTQQQVSRFFAAPNPIRRWTLDSLLIYRKYIFLFLKNAPVPCLLPTLLSFFFSLFFFAFHFFLLVTAAVVFYESGGIFFTWVSVEKGGQSIKFELLKTIATSSSIVVSICLLFFFFFKGSVLIALLL